MFKFCNNIIFTIIKSYTGKVIGHSSFFTWKRFQVIFSLSIKIFKIQSYYILSKIQLTIQLYSNNLILNFNFNPSYYILFY